MQASQVKRRVFWRDFTQLSYVTSRQKTRFLTWLASNSRKEQKLELNTYRRILDDLEL